MRLANKAGLPACAAELSGKPLLRCFWRQVDAIVTNAVRQRQFAGQDGRPRRLAYRIGRDRRGKPASFGGHEIKVGGFHPPPGKAEAVSPMLIRRDEEDVGRAHFFPFVSQP